MSPKEKHYHVFFKVYKDGEEITELSEPPATIDDRYAAIEVADTWVAHRAAVAKAQFVQNRSEENRPLTVMYNSQDMEEEDGNVIQVEYTTYDNWKAQATVTVCSGKMLSLADILMRDLPVTEGFTSESEKYFNKN